MSGTFRPFGPVFCQSSELSDRWAAGDCVHQTVKQRNREIERSLYSDCGRMKGFLDLDHTALFTHIEFLCVFWPSFGTTVATLVFQSRSLIFSQVYEISSSAIFLGNFNIGNRLGII